MDARITQLEGAYRSYVDQIVTIVRLNLQAELDGKVVILKAKLQQQLNGVKKSIGDSL